MIFDTHAHYEDKAFDEDRESLLLSMREGGVGRIVNVASTWESNAKVVELTKKYPFIYGALGIHPSEIRGVTEENMEMIRAWAGCKYADEVSGCEHDANGCKHDANGCEYDSKILAIGEIGLDYYWDKDNHEEQKDWFRRQLRMARELKLPVIIHSREAAQDTMDLMKAEHAEDIGGVIHCYSYEAPMALEYVKMGFYIGVGGVVTYKNGRKLKETVAAVPMERIVLETDCPYLTPQSHRGTRNSSLYLPEVVAQIAEIKGLLSQEVEDITWENACRLYRMN